MRHVRYVHGEITMTPPISTEEVISAAKVANEELKLGKRDRSYALDQFNSTLPTVEYGDVELSGDIVEHPLTAGKFYDIRPATDEPDDLDEMVAALGEIVTAFATAPDGSLREFSGWFDCELSEAFGDACQLHVVDGEVVEIEPEIDWPDPVMVKIERDRAEGR